MKISPNYITFKELQVYVDLILTEGQDFLKMFWKLIGWYPAGHNEEVVKRICIQQLGSFI